MEIGKSIYNILVNDTNVYGKVDNRIFPNVAPQTTVFPFSGAGVLVRTTVSALSDTGVLVKRS